MIISAVSNDGGKTMYHSDDAPYLMAVAVSGAQADCEKTATAHWPVTAPR